MKEKEEHSSLLPSLLRLAESLPTVAPWVGVLEAHLLCNTFSLLHTIAKLCYNKVESQQLSSSGVGCFKFLCCFHAPSPHFLYIHCQINIIQPTAVNHSEQYVNLSL